MIKKITVLIILAAFIIAFVNIKDIAAEFFPFPYRETVEKYAEKHDLDPYFLAAVIKTESNFDPYARSKKGALGLMQVMPETGQWTAEKAGITPFSPGILYEPEINIRLGTWYLKNLLNTFNGDKVLALAAYNGGQGNVKKWLIEKSHNNEQLDVSQIPFPETRNFVKKVNRYQKIYEFIYS